ncbi:hypothetical protein E3A20_17660, partial [Planctomyces bekefii]
MQVGKIALACILLKHSAAGNRTNHKQSWITYQPGFIAFGGLVAQQSFCADRALH